MVVKLGMEGEKAVQIYNLSVMIGLRREHRMGNERIRKLVGVHKEELNRVRKVVRPRKRWVDGMKEILGYRTVTVEQAVYDKSA